MAFERIFVKSCTTLKLYLYICSYATDFLPLPVLSCAKQRSADTYNILKTFSEHFLTVFVVASATCHINDI